MVELGTCMDRLAPGCRPRQSPVGYFDGRETLAAAHALPPLREAPLAHFAGGVDVEAFRLERP